jgi:hypothetical protein
MIPMIPMDIAVEQHDWWVVQLRVENALARRMVSLVAAG